MTRSGQLYLQTHATAELLARSAIREAISEPWQLDRAVTPSKEAALRRPSSFTEADHRKSGVVVKLLLQLLPQQRPALGGWSRM